ncbi:MAG: alcohol dehydrogenase catalytic domain-containing protein, partial [Nitrososphaerales archaeon]
QLGIKSRLHVVPTVISELRLFLSDLLTAAGEGALLERAGEISLFRFHKARGAVGGLLDGSVMQNKAMRDILLFDRAYKAVVIQSPRHASLGTVQLPAGKPGDVLIKVAYEGVCATDLHILEGNLGYYKTGLAKYPVVPGHEFSGRVVRVGTNVSHLKVGDPVVVECIQTCGVCALCQQQNGIGCRERREVGVMGLNGGYSEFVVMPGRYVHKLPPEMDLRMAAISEPLAVVLKGLRRLRGVLASSDRSERCAVVGTGPVGHLCAKVLSLLGHQVTAYDRDTRRLAYFDGGPIVTASNNLESLQDYNVIVEATGDPDALHATLGNSTPGATILLLGLPYAHREFNFESVVAYDKAIIGSVGSSGEDFEEAIRLLPKLDLAPFVERVLPLEQFQIGWAETRERRYLKVLLEVDPTC